MFLRYASDLNDQNREGGLINEGYSYELRMQWVFGSVEFGAARIWKHRFVLVSVVVKTENSCEVEKWLLLFRTSGKAVTHGKEHAFLL